MITSTAERIELIPSVAMNEFTPNFTTMNALTPPIASPMTTPARIAGTTPQWWLFRSTTLRIPETFAVAPTDRSYSPVASGISTAKPIMPVTAC